MDRNKNKKMFKERFYIYRNQPPFSKIPNERFDVSGKKESLTLNGQKEWANNKIENLLNKNALKLGLSENLIQILNNDFQNTINNCNKENLNNTFKNIITTINNKENLNKLKTIYEDYYLIKSYLNEHKNSGLEIEKYLELLNIMKNKHINLELKSDDILELFKLTKNIIIKSHNNLNKVDNINDINKLINLNHNNRDNLTIRKIKKIALFIGITKIEQETLDKNTKEKEETLEKNTKEEKVKFLNIQYLRELHDKEINDFIEENSDNPELQTKAELELNKINDFFSRLQEIDEDAYDEYRAFHEEMYGIDLKFLNSDDAIYIKLFNEKLAKTNSLSDLGSQLSDDTSDALTRLTKDINAEKEAKYENDTGEQDDEDYDDTGEDYEDDNDTEDYDDTGEDYEDDNDTEDYDDTEDEDEEYEDTGEQDDMDDDDTGDTGY